MNRIFSFDYASFVFWENHEHTLFPPLVNARVRVDMQIDITRVAM